MRSLFGIIIVVAVLVLAGETVRRAAILEERLADGQEQLTTTSRVLPATDADLDQSMVLTGRIPLIGASLERTVRLHRAEVSYWQGDYTTLAPTPGAAATLPEPDPQMLLLVANAGFRSAVKQNRTAPTLARVLDEVLKAYATVLQADPASTTAAYNYEYVARLRTALTSNRNATVPAQTQQNMQGEQGEPPEGAQKSDFNVIVPLRPEERQEQMDPGAGATFQRKG